MNAAKNDLPGQDLIPSADLIALEQACPSPATERKTARTVPRFEFRRVVARNHRT